MKAHGSPGAGLARQMTPFVPDAAAERMMEKAGTDRLDAFCLAIGVVRGGGTISPIGVHAGMADPPPMLTLFDRRVKPVMGQANVKRWTDDIMPPLTGDGDPLGDEGFRTHRLPPERGPRGHEIFQNLPEKAGQRGEDPAQASGSRAKDATVTGGGYE